MVDRDGSVYRQGTNREFGSAQFVDRPLRAVDSHDTLGESELISEFVSEVLVLFFFPFVSSLLIY